MALESLRTTALEADMECFPNPEALAAEDSDSRSFFSNIPKSCEVQATDPQEEIYNDM